MKSPIFIFSMPRAGSTLLQRILLSHNAIGGTAEPWILLPLIYLNKSEGVLSEYSSRLSSKAINDVLKEIPDAENFYNSQIKEFADGLYSKILKNNETYFLDKTPRYYLIIDEIYKIYPDAKFIFLFRNPTNIYSSILKTWCNNKFSKLYGSHNDLTFGFNKISEAYKKYKDYKNTIAIRYEDLVSAPNETLKIIQEFLEIKYDDKLTHSFITFKIDTKNQNVLGDPTGIEEYKSINNEPLNKWKKVFSTRFRKIILKKYIRNTLTKESLSLQGYSQDEIIKDINILKNSGRLSFFSDSIHYCIYKLIIRFNLYNFASKDMIWIKEKFMS